MSNKILPYHNKTTMKNLKVTYIIILLSLRRVLGLSSYISASVMFVNLNIPSFGELLRKYVYNCFRKRLEISDNVIIRDIYLSHFPL